VQRLPVSVVYRQNAQTLGAYTLALSDAGRAGFQHDRRLGLFRRSGSVAFPIGTAIARFNNSGSSQTVSITTDTLRLAGTATTGTRTVAQYGLVTCVKVASTTWVISGAGSQLTDWGSYAHWLEVAGRYTSGTATVTVGFASAGGFSSYGKGASQGVSHPRHGQTAA